MAARHSKAPKEFPAGEYPAAGRARRRHRKRCARGRRRAALRSSASSASRSWSRPTASPTVTTASRCAVLLPARTTRRIGTRRRWSRSATTAGAARSPLTAVGRYRYAVTAWVDPFLSWRHDFARRVEVEDLRIAAAAGADLVAAAGARAAGADRDALAQWAARLRGERAVPDLRVLALDAELAAIASRYPDRAIRDHDRDRISAWSSIASGRASARGTSSSRVRCGPDSSTHGTFRDCASKLPYVAADGLRRPLPAADPSDRARAAQGPQQCARGRPGRRRQPVGDRRSRGRTHGDPSGARHARGFPRLVAASARKLGIEIALDIAFQCAPDHP